MNTQLSLEQVVTDACKLVNNDRGRLMDILIYVQKQLRGISGEAMELIAKQLNSHRVEIEGMVTFYSFFSRETQGEVIIRLCDDIIDQHQGLKQIEEAASNLLNIKIGETTADSKFTLEHTPCIGMCDQAPAAIINDVIFTQLTPEKITSIIKKLKKGTSIEELVTKYGDGINSHKLVKSMVKNNVMAKEDYLLGNVPEEQGLKKAIKLSPQDILKQIKNSKLRGRGGAGFPTGVKWQTSADTKADHKYVICNADEGEPGTFKDRVLLTERAGLLFEGMTVAGYAIGAKHGILYLRGEYSYLQAYLEQVLADRKANGLLGRDILGKSGFDFDIRIQMGAGAYICGEESSLISSCEGGRGEPKNRPPFPVTSGYLGYPTVVNNVETLCCAARIVAKGADWFKAMGTEESSGTKLISICGDCARPGVYEVPFGLTINDMLAQAGAKDTAAVMVGGPSGEIINPAQFNRKISFEDAATGGAILVFNETRNLLKIVSYYMDFFIDESCGYCTPCRVGNVFLNKTLDKIREGKAAAADIDGMKKLSNTIIRTSRCGLGKTSPNPILSSLRNFPLVYSTLLKESFHGMQSTFDIQDALEESRTIAKRGSVIYDTSWEKAGDRDE